MTCKLDIVEDPFTPAAAARARLSRSTFPSAFVRADTFLSYGLAEHGKGKPFLAPVLSGWEEATARNSHITFPVAGSCSVWTMSRCLRRRPSQCRDSEWNMVVVVGGRKAPAWICQLKCLRCGEWGYLDVAVMYCANRESESVWRLLHPALFCFVFFSRLDYCGTAVGRHDGREGCWCFSNRSYLTCTGTNQPERKCKQVKITASPLTHPLTKQEQLQDDS